MNKYKFECGCEFDIIKENGVGRIPLVKFDYNTDFRESCPAVWKLYEKGLALGCFQLDSPLGIKWTKELKPTCVEHLAALTALLRPGALGNLDSKGISATQHYVDRKNGKEPITYPIKALEPILKTTYSTLVYQEQSIRIGIEIAGFTPSEADSYLRKGIGTKNSELLFAAQTKFLEGAKRLGKVTDEEAIGIFNQIKASARYAFNKCLDYHTPVRLVNNVIKPLQFVTIGDLVHTPQGFKKVIKKYWNGQKHLFRYRTYRGTYLTCTADHKILCTNKTLTPIHQAFTEQKDIVTYSDKLYEKPDRISSCEYWNYDWTVDIEIDSDEHLFYANDIVVTNSHSIAYGLHSFHDMYLKAHFSLHFYISKLKSPRNSTTDEDISNFIYEAKLFDIETKLPDLRHFRPEFYNDGKHIYFGLSNIKGLGNANFVKLTEAIKPQDLTTNWLEFALNCSCKCSPSVISLLIESGSCDWMGLSRSQMLEEYKLVAGLTKVELTNLKRHYDVSKLGVNLNNEPVN